MESTQLVFFLAPGEASRPGASLERVEARLPGGRGGLRSLFRAFGLDEGLEAGEADEGLGPEDTSLVDFLQEQVGKALALQKEVARLKLLVEAASSEVVREFGLADLAVGGAGLKGAADLEWSLSAVEKLQAALRGLRKEEAAELRGQRLHLHRDRSWGGSAPAKGDGSSGSVAAGGNLRTLGEDGRIHLVADGAIAEQLGGLNAEEARVLSRLEQYWTRRIEQLAPAATEVLGVKSVVCDHLINPAAGQDTAAGAQAFVLWAGKLLSNKEAFALALKGRKFDFSVLVHGDLSQEDPVYAHPSSHVVQVRDNCPPHALLKYLVTGGGGAAQEAAEAVWGERAEESELLDRVREVFGARHVIRVCPADSVPEVIAAAERLLESAEQLQRQGVDLSGACLAIDDCYEVWDSGFISIPHDFEVGELCVRLQAALPGPSADGDGEGPGAMGGVRGRGAPGGAGGEVDEVLHPGVSLPDLQPPRRANGRSVTAEAFKTPTGRCQRGGGVVTPRGAAALRATRNFKDAGAGRIRSLRPCR